MVLSEGAQKEILNTYNQYLVSAQKIKKILKDKYTLAQIKSVVDNIETQQVFRNETKKNKYIHISAPAGSYQMDLTFYTQYKTFNKGYHILLTIINMNTRKLYVYPLKTKSMKEVSKNIQDFLSKTDPCSISSDKGTEFNNNELEKIFKERQIQYIVFNKSDMSNNKKNTTSIIERANRTIRQMIDKYLLSQNTNQFIGKLSDLVQAYNQTPHSSLPDNMRPNDITDKEQDWYENQPDHEQKQKDLQQIEQKYKIGDHVRVLKNKKEYEKGARKFRQNIYKITQINNQEITVQNEKTKKELLVRPYQIMVIDKDKLIQQIQDDKQKQQKNKQLNEVKKQNKQQKRLKKEGIQLEDIFKPAPIRKI